MTVRVCGRGVAGEPAQIKCSLNGSSKVRLGQKVDGDIQVNVKDKHGNEIKKVRRRLNTALNVGSRTFPIAGANVWNSLPDDVISALSLSTFRRHLKTYLFRCCYNTD